MKYETDLEFDERESQEKNFQEDQFCRVANSLNFPSYAIGKPYNVPSWIEWDLKSLTFLGRNKGLELLFPGDEPHLVIPKDYIVLNPSINLIVPIHFPPLRQFMIKGPRCLLYVSYKLYN